MTRTRLQTKKIIQLIVKNVALGGVLGWKLIFPKVQKYYVKHGDNQNFIFALQPVIKSIPSKISIIRNCCIRNERGIFTIEEATAYISFKDVYLTRSEQQTDRPEYS